MTLNLDANYTCCMWYILMTTMYISHGKVDMELKITWVTAEFVNMDLNLTNNDELFTKDCCNGEKNEELKSAFLKHYKSLINNWGLYTSCSWLPENPQFTLFDTKGIGES